MRLVFMGTPAFSVPVLEALAAQHEIAAVYTQPPRPAGRGKADRKSPVQLCAESLGIPVRYPVSLRSEGAVEDFTSLRSEVAVVVAYGLILPSGILAAPLCGCLNIHASLLPRWRGAAPIHRAVMAGDAETGVCIMQMEAGLDTGPVLLREAVAIGANDTTADLHDRLSTLGARLILQALAELPDLVPEPQPETGVTYATKIDKAEARVEWTKPAVEVDRLIRGLSPFPGAWCQVGGERLKLLRSRVAEAGLANGLAPGGNVAIGANVAMGTNVVTGAGPAPRSALPGQVLHGLTIACGVGAVEVLEAQREGKKPAATRDLLRGFALPGFLT